jgi:branched-chain amino acid transport system permease protein
LVHELSKDKIVVLKYAAVSLMLLIFPFAASRIWLNFAVFIGIYVILTVGLTLLFGYANQLSFGHAGFFGLGAYTSVLGSPYVSVWGGFILAALLSALVGYIFGRPILRLRGLSLGLATMAFGQIMSVLFLELHLTGGAIGLSGIPAPSFGEFQFDTAVRYYWLVLLVATFVVYLSVRIGDSYIGRALKAIGTNEGAARVAGVDVESIKASIFAYSAALAGLAGALYAHYVTFISADSFRGEFSILVILIVAVGGRASFLGAILGSILLTIVPQYLREFQQYAMLLYGVMLVVVFMYLPGGLVGLIRSNEKS